MCLAILKPVESHVTKRKLRTGYKGNPDGAGFMFAADNEIQISKGYFSFRSFYKAFRQAERENPNSNFVIHFRIATSGQIDKDTCHPFYVNPKLGFAHNGVFSKMGNKKISDTQQYNRQILKSYPKDFIYKPKFVKKISNFCGWFNKLVFLDNKNSYLIVNENDGVWDGDVWFSNLTYIDEPEPKSKSTWAKYVDDYEDECKDWRNCNVCNGFYPVDEMYLVETNEYICESCDDFVGVLV